MVGLPKWTAVLLLAYTWSTAAGKVPHYSTRSFEESTANDKDTILIDIYAPWCTHCRQLEPIWEEVAEKLDGKVKVAKIDAEENSALRDRFFVASFPTIVLLNNKKTYQYSGPRTVEKLVNWALEGYRHTEAVPFYKAPNSTFGRYLGVVLGAPSRLLRFQEYLIEEWHFSRLAIGLTFISGPLILGILFIYFLDKMALRSAQSIVDHHEHQS